MAHRTACRMFSLAGPSLILQEVLYGFIMALLFVTAARFGLLRVSDGELVVLIIGMNVTWGFVDMVIFSMVDIMDQKHYVQILKRKDLADDDPCIEGLIENELSGTIVDVIDDEDQKDVVRRILVSRIEPEEDLKRERREMMLGGLACFVITALTVIPVAVPLLIIPNPWAALTVASAVSSTCLFFVGFYIAPYVGHKRWTTGLAVTAIAWAITIAGTFTGG